MSPLVLIILMLLGLGILTWGADVFVNAASRVARDFGISPLIIGLTVVAFGTSAPELAVNLIAVYQGNPNIATGNVVGSNILNVAIILGSCACIAPLLVNPRLIKIDIPIMVLLSLVLWGMCLDHKLVMWEGLALSLGIVGYLLIQLKCSHDPPELVAPTTSETADARWKDILKLSGGLLMLLAGARMFVDGAVTGARLLGWSETLISLTIVAAGTSLPEFATSVVATYKGERDIAIGNVVGSNIFNILSVLGISSLMMNLPIEQELLSIDIPYMTLIAIFCLSIAYFKRTIGRISGALLMVSYIAYMGYR